MSSNEAELLTTGAVSRRLEVLNPPHKPIDSPAWARLSPGRPRRGRLNRDAIAASRMSPVPSRAAPVGPAGCLPVHQTGAAHLSIETTRLAHPRTCGWFRIGPRRPDTNFLRRTEHIVSQGRTNLLVFSQNGREQHGTIDCQCTVEVECCTPTPHSSQPHLGDKQREHAWTMFAILQGRCLCCF